jgi:hypothetical protein
VLEADAVCSDDPVSGAGAVDSVEDVVELDATSVVVSEPFVFPVAGVESSADALASAEDVAELDASFVVALEPLVVVVAGVDVEETNGNECTIYVPSTELRIDLLQGRHLRSRSGIRPSYEPSSDHRGLEWERLFHLGGHRW